MALLGGVVSVAGLGSSPLWLFRGQRSRLHGPHGETGWQSYGSSPAGNSLLIPAARAILSLSATFGISIATRLGAGLRASYLGLCELPGLARPLPSPSSGRFLSLFLRMGFQFLAVSLLLRLPLRCECWLA